jgi:FKBP-type peptidyl-prolyl cis-trans isomerase (trigger factor)
MIKYTNEYFIFSYNPDTINNTVNTTSDHSQSIEKNAIISIKSPLVQAFYSHALHEQKKNYHISGFSKGSVPIAYIEKTCKQYILEHIKEFFFNYSIITFLCQELHNHKIVVAGDPVLKSVVIDPSQDAQFIFSFSTINPDLKNEWKKFPFKAPGRKNYKDLDRQVQAFLKEEEEKRSTIPQNNVITISDWVCFSVSLVTIDDQHKLLACYQSPLWLKIGKEEADREAHLLFVGKKVGDVFTTQSPFLQRYFSKKLDTNYVFEIKILDYVSAGAFSLELFQHHFKIKTAKELHQKFIEIFSFRNDVSQRREMVDTAIRTLLKYYHIQLPYELIQRQEEFVLNTLRKNPDYPVYKSQKDFYRKVTLLAEKQLKEEILIDHIAHQELIALTEQDIRAYLNMLQRNRTKEFIHFSLPPTQLSGQEQPIPAGIVNKACIREKTLNYVIHRLIHG